MNGFTVTHSDSSSKKKSFVNTLFRVETISLLNDLFLKEKKMSVTTIYRIVTASLHHQHHKNNCLSYSTMKIIVSMVCFLFCFQWFAYLYWSEKHWSKCQKNTCNNKPITFVQSYRIRGQEKKSSNCIVWHFFFIGILTNLMKTLDLLR